MMMPILLLRKKDRPTIEMSFLGGVLPEGMTFARASNAWYFNSSGILTQASSDVPRFDYDPITGALKGLLLEEQRTNSIRNSIASGVNPPSTLPTNWLYINGTGLTKTIVGTGTENGMNYVDIRWSGTAGDIVANLRFDASGQIPAVQNEIWNGSLYIKHIGGSLSNIQYVYLVILERDNSLTLIDQGSGTDVKSLLNSTNYTRATVTRTIAQSAAAYAQLQLAMGYANGASVDFTLRVAQPQQEKGAFTTSPILTTGSSAVTRAADSLHTTSIDWFNTSKGSLAGEFINAGVKASTFPRVVSFNNNDTSNDISLYLNSTPYIKAFVNKNGVSQADMVLGNLTVGSVTKAAMRYEYNNIAGCANGGSVVTDTTAEIPTVDRMRIFGSVFSSTFIQSGWVRRVAYWNYPLDNAALVRVTQ